MVLEKIKKEIKIFNNFLFLGKNCRALPFPKSIFITSIFLGVGSTHSDNSQQTKFDFWPIRVLPKIMPISLKACRERIKVNFQKIVVKVVTLAWRVVEVELKAVVCYLLM